MSCRSASLACLLALLTYAPLYAQTVQPASAATTRRETDCLKGAVRDLKQILTEPADEKSGKISRLLQRWPVYLCYMAADTEVTRALLGVAEEQRQDKQPGASASSSGSTSLVNKGSSPWLLGFALEHGGLSQSADGNTITFRGNVANSLKALMKNSYLASYELSEDDPLVQYLSKLSLGVSFNTAAPQASSAPGFFPSSSTLAGFSAKYEVANHRDPRDKRWRARWHELSTTVGLDFTSSAGELGEVLRANPKYDEWIGHARNALLNLPPGAKDPDIQKILEDAAESFITIFGNNAEVTNAIQRLSESISNYVKRENTVFSEIRATPVVTVQYDFTRQSLPGS